MVEEMKGGCIRVQSSTNEWMDCIFLVSPEDKERAKAGATETSWRRKWWRLGLPLMRTTQTWRGEGWKNIKACLQE